MKPAERGGGQRHAEPRKAWRGPRNRQAGRSLRRLVAVRLVVVVTVRVYRAGMSASAPCVPVPRERRYSGAEANMFGRTGAADMAVEADHPVRGRHHHMQFVADHQHGAVDGRP